MMLEGFRVGRNVAAGYSGHGEFALSYVRLSRGQRTREPKALALSSDFAKPLPAGTYRVFLKYIDPCRVRVTLGDASVEHDIPRGKRYEAITVRTKRPANRFRLQVVACGPRVIFDYFFISNDPAYTLKRRRGRNRLEKRPTPRPFAPTDARNAIANGSFEAGVPVGWSTPYQGNLALFGSLLDETQHTHGRYSLKVPITRVSRAPKAYTSSRMTHEPVAVRKGAVLWFAFDVRSDRKAKVVAWARLIGSRDEWRREVAAQAEWRRVGLRVGPVPEDGHVQVGLALESDGPGNVWLDAMQLGAGLEYEPAAPLEAGPVWTRPANIMIAGRDEVMLSVQRSMAATGKATFEYRLFDLDDRVLADESLDLSRRPKGASRVVLPFPHLETGVYRLHYRTVSGETVPCWRQASFCVLADTSAVRDAPIGVYGSFAPQALDIYRLAGFRAINTLSAGAQIGSWYIMEPVYGRGYFFYDEDVENAIKRRIRVVANLHTVPYAWPKGLPLAKTPPAEPWVKHRRSGYFPLSAWRNFVRAVGRHYRGRIREWVVIDEPSAQYEAKEYLKLLKASYEELKRADPANRVFMHGHIAADRTYIDRLDALGAPQYCDALYDYCRTRRAAERLAAWKRKHGKPLYTVEYGGFTTFYVSDSAGLERPFSLLARDNVDTALLSALRSLAWPQAERYFRYDARYTGHHGYMTMFHPDGTLKPAGVALAVLNAKISGMKPAEEPAVPAPLEGFRFASTTKELLAVHHPQRRAVRLRFRNLAGLIRTKQLEITDALGRRIVLAGKRRPPALVVDRHFRYFSFAPEVRPAVLAELANAGITVPLSATASLDRRAGRPVSVEIVLTNRTDTEFQGYVCPDRASLFHLDGFAPFREDRLALQRRFRQDIHIAPQGSAKAEFVLNYPAGHRFRKSEGSTFGIAVEGSYSQVLEIRLDQVK